MQTRARLTALCPRDTGGARAPWRWNGMETVRAAPLVALVSEGRDVVALQRAPTRAGRRDITEATRWAPSAMHRPFQLLGLTTS